MRKWTMVVVVALAGCGGDDALFQAAEQVADAAPESAQDAPWADQGTGAQAEAEAATEAGPEGAADAPEEPEAGDASGETDAGCQDAPCHPADINCDPACGTVDAACAATCDINADFAHQLPIGVTRIRMPRLDAQSLKCSACGEYGAWWSFLAKLPDGSCGAMIGPSGLWLASKYVAKGEHPKSGTCAASNGGGCASFGSATGPSPLDTYLYITTTHPMPGFVVTFDVRQTGDCGGMSCDATCNGSVQ
jgi:hypothetical protein